MPFSDPLQQLTQLPCLVVYVKFQFVYTSKRDEVELAKSFLVWHVTKTSDALKSRYLERKPAWVRYILAKPLSNLSQAHHEALDFQGPQIKKCLGCKSNEKCTRAY